jgi:hypothetical protein
MSTRLEAKETLVSKDGLIKALWRAWVTLFHEVPKKESIWLLMAQVALETGWMDHCKCYNLGNVKSREGDGFDYCYFACNEILPKAIAEKYASQSPDTAKITQYRTDGKAIIWFYPDHPGCRFRAFHSLTEGAIDHINLVHKRFSKAWPAVLSGDPKTYCSQLKSQGYFTADLETYTSSVSSIFSDLKKLPIDYNTIGEDKITEDEAQRIMNLVTLTVRSEME